MRSYLKDPMALMYPIEVTNYLDRSYAPVEQRLASLAELLRGVPAYLDSIRALLVPPFAKLPRPIVCKLRYTVDAVGTTTEVSPVECPDAMQANAIKAGMKWRL